MNGSDASTPTPTPGWYADPAGRFPVRWWDGTTWTERVTDADGAEQADLLPEPDETDVPAASGAPAAGWYADPAGQFPVRWWDGTAWTERVTDTDGVELSKPLPAGEPTAVFADAFHDTRPGAPSPGVPPSPGPVPQPAGGASRSAKAVAIGVAVALVVGGLVGVAALVGGNNSHRQASVPVTTGGGSSGGGTSTSGGGTSTSGGGTGTSGGGGPAADALRQLQQKLSGMSTAHTGSDAQPWLQSLADSMQAAANAGNNLRTIQTVVDTADAAGLSTASGRAAISTTGAALNGHAVKLTASPSAAQRSLGLPTPTADVEPVAATSPPITVYYVNGVYNTEANAIEGAQQVVNTLAATFQRSVELTLVHNHSFKEDASMAAWSCLDTVRNLEPVPRETGIGEALCRSAFPGLVAYDAVHVLKAGAELFGVSLPQLFRQRVLDSQQASDPVNSSLVRLAEEDIKAGKRVLLVAHSQGGLFINHAYQELQTWWVKEQTVKTKLGCEAPVPAATLYIAPPFGTGDELSKDPARYVMFEGDWLIKYFVSSVTPNATPVPPQTVNDSLGTEFPVHFLKNYLYDVKDFTVAGSASRQLVQSGAQELQSYLLGIKGLDQPCTGGEPGGDRQKELPGTYDVTVTNDRRLSSSQCPSGPRHLRLEVNIVFTVTGSRAEFSDNQSGFSMYGPRTGGDATGPVGTDEFHMTSSNEQHTLASFLVVFKSEGGTHLLQGNGPTYAATLTGTTADPSHPCFVTLDGRKVG